MNITNKMFVFVVQHTNFDYKPSHMYISCEGVFQTWESALKAALKISSKEVEEVEEDEDEKDEDQPSKIFEALPTNRKELADLLPVRGCVWDFENESCAEWCDGDDIGSHLVSISKQEIQK